MIYKFKIVETYNKDVEIEAENEDKAREIIENNYMEGKIKFDSADNFSEWEIYKQ